MISIVPLKKEHLSALTELEQECFSVPWTYQMFLEEIESPLTSYYAALDENQIIGYAGMWKIVDEGHITNIAVKKEYRNKKIGSMLLERLLSLADDHALKLLTLEVRRSNEAAKGLYSKYGFKSVGLRRGYYSDNNEDAVIMTCYLNKLSMEQGG